MPGRLSRNLLSISPDAHQRDAAWDLLTAVHDVFPERFAELENLGRYRVVRATEWTQKNRIACPAVDDIATRIALGEKEPSETVSAVLWTNEKGEFEDPPNIRAEPLDETFDDFIRRARQHYREAFNWYRERGYKKRPVKREIHHFQYLVAHLIGRYSWADIAAGRTPFKFPRKSAKTVAGEARIAAQLVGIALPSTPGPRPGSRVRRRRPRR